MTLPVDGLFNTNTLFCLFQILNEIAQHKIKIYEFPECDDEEENKVQKKLRVSTSSGFD